MSAAEAVKAIKKKEIKARELVENAITRLEYTNDRLKSLITITGENALQQADAVDKKVSADEALPPLGGIPLVIKDDLALEGIPNTVGTKALENNYSPFSAEVVQRSIDSGGAVMGKANMDEFGMGATTKTSSYFWSRNPLDLDRTAGEGAAAAVSANQAMLAIASDTGGGLREAASYCGIMGLCPTPGVISRYGLTSFSSSLSEVGLLARKAEDFLLMLDIASGYDPRDFATSALSATSLKDDLIENNIITAGYPTEIWQQVEAPFKDNIENNIELFKNCNMEFQEVSLPYFKAGLLAYYILVISESFSNLSRFDGIRYGYHYEGANLEEWYQKTRKHTFGEEARRRSFLGAYLLNEDNYKKYYEKALQVWTLVKDDFSRVFEKCDLLILPVTRLPAPLLEETKSFTENYQIDEFCAPVSLAGLPSLCLPVSKSNDLPVSVQLVGKPFSEKSLIKLSMRLESEANVSFMPVI